MRDQFGYTLKTGKNESWSGFELFQPYFCCRFPMITDN